jgi:GrpB-like predicted nucleotidyltransferase (UPF0157 family)
MGSTAVPGLPAKPIIDMVAVVGDIDDTAAAVAPLAAIGWLHAPEPADEAERHLSFCRPTIERRTHHIHVVEERADEWKDWLAFRDLLRGNPDARRRYADLKVALAAAHGQDPNQRDAYRAGKTALVGELLAHARPDRTPR